MRVKDLSIEEKIGQMLMIGIGSKKDIPAVLNMIENSHIGGVLLYKNNYSDYEEMITLINNIYKANQKNKIPILIAIDQEGGIVNRMPNEFDNIYSAHKLGLTSNLELIKNSASITSEMLKETGINLNFAPVLDILNLKNKGLSNRSFSENPKEVAKYSYTYMKELNKNKIISVIKHFPGHGATKIDSHALIPVVKKYKKLSKDLYPFQYIIDKKCDALMIAHIIIKDVDKYYPCSISKKFITEKLRKELNYEGLIITDELRMKGLRLLYGKNRALKKAFQAGNDVVLIKYKPNDEQIIERIKKYIKNENDLDKHVERIINLKKKYNLSIEKEVKGCNIKNINTKIKALNKKIEKTQ